MCWFDESDARRGLGILLTLLFLTSCLPLHLALFRIFETVSCCAPEDATARPEDLIPPDCVRPDTPYVRPRANRPLRATGRIASGSARVAALRQENRWPTV